VWIDTSNKRPTEQVFEEICQHVERWNAGVWMVSISIVVCGPFAIIYLYIL
jgi:hypothetical protein